MLCRNEQNPVKHQLRLIAGEPHSMFYCLLDQNTRNELFIIDIFTKLRR